MDKWGTLDLKQEQERREGGRHGGTGMAASRRRASVQVVIRGSCRAAEWAGKKERKRSDRGERERETV